jgi:hypothetical protein
MSNNNSDQFDPYVFIDELIVEMGMQNADPVKLTKLKSSMFDALARQLFPAAQDHIEPEIVDMVLEDLKDEEDPLFIIQELVQTSPSCQLAMLAALDIFRENTLEAFNKLKV